MTRYDFSRLTELQRDLLSCGGWSVTDAPARTQPAKRTVAKLLERGLLTESKRAMGAFRDDGPTGWFYVTEYAVPPAVALAWCERRRRGGK